MEQCGQSLHFFSLAVTTSIPQKAKISSCSKYIISKLSYFILPTTLKRQLTVVKTKKKTKKKPSTNSSHALKE